MAANLRVSGTRAYQLNREVEAVPPYPRVNAQRPRDEYPRQREEHTPDQGEHARRRFGAMRKLIDDLMKETGIGRVDYFTAEAELNELGFSILEDELPSRLSSLNVSSVAIDDLFQQLREKKTSPCLEAGRSLSESYNFFPVFIAGISEYNLCFKRLQLQPDEKMVQVNEALERDGCFFSEEKRLRLEFCPASSAENISILELNVTILVAVSEVDDAGRRVILYQRPNQSYALYADKQINLSI